MISFGNDILDATGGSPQTLGNEIAFGLASSIELLERAGARNILTSNLLDVGQLPAAKAEGISSFATAASLATNKALDWLLLLESFSPKTRIYRIDAYALFQSVLTDPAHYGFNDVTDPCLTTAVCANPYVNFFWDEELDTLGIASVHRVGDWETLWEFFIKEELLSCAAPALFQRNGKSVVPFVKSSVRR